MTGDVTQEAGSKRTVLAADPTTGWELVHATAGLEPAGSGERWTNEKWGAIRLDPRSGCAFGEWHSTLSAAQAEFAKRVEQTKAEQAEAEMPSSCPRANMEACLREDLANYEESLAYRRAHGRMGRRGRLIGGDAVEERRLLASIERVETELAAL